MERYQHFSLAGYVYAYYLDGITEEKLRNDIEFYKAHLPINKAYLETHRALVDIPEDTMKMAIRVFRENGITVSGGITTTAKVGEAKPALFDCYCYSDPAHRESLLQTVRYTASLFDEIILDDYFFHSCRCELCIAQKGKRSWKDFKLAQMEEFSGELVTAAKEVNPSCNFIIKYPNWYESYQECGYNPRAQKDIFDMIYTGTESRNSNYSGQHLQRYMSYSIMRLMENIAPGRNGGGWIDLGGSMPNISIYVQQAELAYFSKAKELMLFNFASMIDSPAGAALGIALERLDRLYPLLGNPTGVSVYEPYDSDGEDQLINYIGQCGIPLEPVPFFDEKAPEIFLTQNSAMDPEIMTKLEKYVREGGIAVVTSGFMHEAMERGLSDMTSVRPTDRKVTGTRYELTNINVSSREVCVSDEPVTFTVMNHKNNATWYDVLLHVNDFSTAVMTEDYYGKGFLYILNIPDNYGDLYKLPGEVIGAVAKNFARRSPLYLSVSAPFNLYLYDNDVFGVYNLNEFRRQSEVTLLGDSYAGFEDLETGERFETPHHIQPRPVRKGDCATCREEPVEKVFKLNVQPGTYRFFKLLKK